MEIAIISDTHVQSIDELPVLLIDRLKEADMIVHLGDYTGTALVDGLKKLGNFHGVCGNMDPPSIREILPEILVLEVNGKRLGLIHGQGSFWNIDDRIKSRFERVDAILYGHTHLARNEFQDSMLLFNPGSASGKFPATRKTYGLLTIDDTIHAEILTIR